jgi:hypothetical protein
MSTAVRPLMLFVLAGAICAQSTTPSLRDRFAGVWKLLSCELKASNGDISYPYGEQPVGRLIYDKAGRMSALLMRPGRRSSYTSGRLRESTREDLVEALTGFTAYFGTYDIDESSRTVIHHVQASIYPSWVGTDLKRTYEFSGNRLTLTAVSGQGVMRLVWKRERD